MNKLINQLNAEISGLKEVLGELSHAHHSECRCHCESCRDCEINREAEREGYSEHCKRCLELLDVTEELLGRIERLEQIARSEKLASGFYSELTCRVCGKLMLVRIGADNRCGDCTAAWRGHN